MVFFGPDSDTREDFQRGLGAGSFGNGAVDLGSQAKGKGPEMVGRKWVAVSSVDKHGASLIGEVMDATFGNAVLMVCIDACKGKALLLVTACGHPFIGAKHTVVGVAVLYLYAPIHGVLLECGFTFEGFLGSRRLL